MKYVYIGINNDYESNSIIESELTKGKCYEDANRLGFIGFIYVKNDLDEIEQYHLSLFKTIVEHREEQLKKIRYLNENYY